MAETIRIHPIPAFTGTNDNYIWSIELNQQAVIVDPGDAKPVLAYLQQAQLALSAIIITHHHWDHIDGIDELLRFFPVPVYGPQSDKIPQITKPLFDGNCITLLDGKLALQVIAVPGHTRDHIAYLSDINANTALFCGDTLFAAGCGRLFDGSYEQFTASLKKINSLPETTLIYCTHEYTLANLRFASAVEPKNAAIAKRAKNEQLKRQHNQPTLPTTLKLERQTNPFLRYQEPQVKEAINHYWEQDWSDDVALFTGLRRWKDSF